MANKDENRGRVLRPQCPGRQAASLSPGPTVAKVSLSPTLLTVGDTLRGNPMLTSKFKAGQVVFLNCPFEQRIREGAYIITKELLGPDGDFMYCIKGVIEPCERVVKASQIKNVGD